MKQSQPPGTPVEHDYMGGSSFSHLHQQDQKVEKEAADHDDDVGDEKKKEILKGTELRLGLPDSSSYYSPYSTRKEESRGYPLLSLGLPFGSSSSSGAKRVFSDAIVGGGGGGGGSAGDNGGEVVGGMGGRELLLFSHNNTPAISSIGKDNHTPQKQHHHHQKQQKEDITTNRKKKDPDAAAGNGERPAAGKAQVIGWPPVRNYRKNSMVANPSKSDVDAKDKHGSGSLYVKVSMDGAPYLRKVDLRTYSDYKELSIALEKMFSCFSIGHCGPHAFPSKDGFNATDLLDGSELVLTFEDKDGDWMLVGDVPWDMFTGSCKRLRIMKGSKAIGLAPRVNNKGQNKELAPKLAT